MLAGARQEKIYKILKEDGAVTTSALMNIFDVSLETVRRDLLLMEKEGKLSRVHGGALLKGDMKTYSSLKQRNSEQKDLKDELAETAVQLINENDIIGIDSGSTAISLANSIKRNFKKLTVVTYSSDVFNIFSDSEGIDVILCGGYYIKEEKSFVGDFTLQMLENLHIQKAFICPTALSLEFGICDYQKDLLVLQKQMIKSADLVYIIADSSKFEKKALIKLDDMKPEYTYITDSSLSDELERLYKENNLKIYR